MRPELNSKLKAKLFAQYWNQKVACQLGGYPIQVEWRTFIEGFEDGDHLVLLPISSMTDHQAIEIAESLMELLWMGNNKKYFSVEREHHMITVTEKYNYRYAVIDHIDGQCLAYEDDKLSGSGNAIWAYQKMISMGFALPFEGYSVQELVNAGFIKFTE